MTAVPAAAHAGAAPAASASEWPAPDSAEAGLSEALRTCCILAETFFPTPLANLEIERSQINAALWSATRDLSDTEISRWRERADPGQWSLRWNAARIAIADLYPHLPAVPTLEQFDAQDSADSGPDPTATSAAPTSPAPPVSSTRRSRRGGRDSVWASRVRGVRWRIGLWLTHTAVRLGCRRPPHVLTPGAS